MWDLLKPLFSLFFLWSAVGVGVQWWWRRLQVQDATRLQGAWLAVIATQLVPVAVLAGVALTASVVPGSSVTVDVGTRYGLSDAAAVLMWAVWTGRRSWRAGAGMAALALLVPGVAALWRTSWEIDPWTFGFVMVGLIVTAWHQRPSGDPTPPLHAEEDPDGRQVLRVTTRSPAVTAGLSLAAVALVLPAIALGLRPSLRGGTEVRLRIWGEAVEIQRGRAVTRLSMAGGSVRRIEDPLGSEGLELVGRSGTHRLWLPGVPQDHVDAIAARLEAATLAPPVPEAAPVPESLRNLQGRSRVTEG